jgi:hypothetical protein
MTPPKKKDWTPDTFPKPRTLPSGWDSSALMSTNGYQDNDEVDSSRTESRDAEDWVPEKFPKPRTLPKNWIIDD